MSVNDTSGPQVSVTPMVTTSQLTVCGAAARQTSGLASEAFGNNASALEASMRASGQSAGPSFVPRSMDSGQFSVNASFSHQRSPAVRKLLLLLLHHTKLVSRGAVV